MVHAETIDVARTSGAEGVSEFEEAYDDWRDLSPDFVRDAFGESIGNVPRREMITVAPSTSIADTVRAMNEGHVGCALVVQGGKLAGVFTERDVLTKVAARSLDAHATPVASVMTADPDTLPAHASVAYALHRMSVEGYRHVPIVDAANRPVGVVAVRDIVAWICDMFPKAVLNLPPVPSSYPKSAEGG